MGRHVASVTLDNLDDLPSPCRSCVFWELDPVGCAQVADAAAAALEKEAWVSATLLEWGACGSLVYVDDEPAAFVLYAPPSWVPRAMSFPTSPVGADAVLMMTGAVLPGYRGGGLGRVLVQSMAKDLSRRGIRAIEAFGRTSMVGADPARAESDAGRCLVPAEFLLAVGFKTVRPHLRYPRLRLDLRTTVSWREDVEGAIERLIGSMTPDPVLKPVRSSTPPQRPLVG